MSVAFCHCGSLFMWGPICGWGMGRLYLPAGPTHPQSSGGLYVAWGRVNCTCQPAPTTQTFGCRFMWGPICGWGTGRLYLPAGPTHPQSSGGLYVAWGWVDCTCQLALTTQTLWLWIHVGANMQPGNRLTVLASRPYPPTVVWGPICGLGTGMGQLYLPAGPNHPDSLVADSCGGQYEAGEWVDCTCQPALPTHTFLGAFIPQNAVAGEPTHSLLAFISSPRLPSTDCRLPCMHSQYG